MRILTAVCFLCVSLLARAQVRAPTSVPFTLPFGVAEIPLSISDPRIEERFDDARARIEAIRSPLVTRPEGARALALAFGEVAQGGCDPNVCFALDGSSLIDADDFQLQKDFVKLVAGVISLDEQSQFAALQYGMTNSIISELTSDANDFLLKVDAAVQIGASRTFVARGIFGCFMQLLRTPFEANHIVLLGDGADNDLTRFGAFGSAGLAQQFLRSGNNQISAVAVGFDDTSGLQSIVGSASRVFSVEQWMDVVDVTAKLVEDVCGVDAIEF
eukprot:TRINITY_DN1751_c0_g2_i1.p1 TRINITY_DN1751_c0_g2~~TRINITY_DN1751_c0_g2_i1.p1  ORF type:complete len:273 (-),score=64.11 TRINITY_DN1751_c0_g2_i1:267-1085(-)